MNEELTPAVRAAVAKQCNEVFADPAATTDQVLEAMKQHLVINSVSFWTASGDITLHLQRAVDALREAKPARGIRRFLGMPSEKKDG